LEGKSGEPLAFRKGSDRLIFVSILVTFFMDSAGGSDSRQAHNKSGRKQLAVVELDEEKLQKLSEILRAAKKKDAKRLSNTPCRLLTIEDGRITLEGKKACYGYQLIALEKFQSDLSRVSPAKSEPNALTISHVCGTRNCINQDHIVLESKKLNDERTHCHTIMTWAQEKGQLQNYLDLNICKHDPPCGSL